MGDDQGELERFEEARFRVGIAEFLDFGVYFFFKLGRNNRELKRVDC